MNEALEGFVPYPAKIAQEYRRKGYWKGRTLNEHLENWVARFADRIAIVADRQRISYRDLGMQVANAATHLAALGIRRGDRVVMQLNNIPEFIYVTFGLMRIGALPIMALPAHRDTEIRYLLEFSGAVAYAAPLEFRGFNYLDMVRRIAPDAPRLKHLLIAGENLPQDANAHSIGAMLRQPNPAGEALVSERSPSSSDVAFFLLSGGTTGLPKLIPRTHDDYEYNFDAAAEVSGLTENTVYLIALPISHNFPLGSPGVMGVFSRGARVVLTPSPSPETAFPVVESERVTMTAHVPAVTIQWLSSPLRDKYNLSWLQLLQVGGSRLSAEVAARVKPLLGATVQQVYGMAEGLLNFTHIDDPDEVLFNTQGRPLSPADEIRIVDWSGNPAAPGEPGELLTRGPYTIRGYYKAPEHNAKAFTEDGFYRTGDVVRLTESGNLSVEGRVKDLINRGGEKISAEEVENLILRHPSVLNVAIVAMPDPVMGEKVCAYVIAREQAVLSLEELRQFMDAAGISKFKLPERLELVERFPLTTVGKISKKDLREDIAAKLRAEGK
ncbi:MAG: 2,3-dihydroxybenzoate-AMP ligase [Betaproteobacteria bacterium RIFCSPLOWO2_12_FULL_63_13]|nr:MAG: 2,3-dihydroxybenzoate-AMP ligase [Betaproteobacteria bacterium RIFCSPLOWO2_12_FULL_63_13]